MQYYVCLCVHLFKYVFASHVLARIIYLCSKLARIVTTETVTTETVTLPKHMVKFRTVLLLEMCALDMVQYTNGQSFGNKTYKFSKYFQPDQFGRMAHIVLL